MSRAADAGLVRLGVRTTFAYRASAIATLVMLVVQVFLLRRVWTTVYAGSPAVGGLTLRDLVVYLTLANLQVFATSAAIGWMIQTRVRSGVVFFDLVRPVGYLRQMVDLQLGSTAGTLLLLLPALPVIFVVGSIAAPASTWAAVYYVLSLAVGYAIAVLLALLVGLAAFWTTEIGGITLLYRLISQFFAGTMAPLSLFPDALRTVAELLPFQFIGYLPAAVYVGAISQPVALRMLAAGFGWLALLGVVVWSVWRRARRRVVVQGG